MTKIDKLGKVKSLLFFSVDILIYLKKLINEQIPIKS